MRGRKVLKIGNYTSEEIEKLFDEKKSAKANLRLCAVYQVSKGRSSRYLSEFYQVSAKTITRWVKRFVKEQGVKGLEDKVRSGRKRRLNETQLEEIKSLLRENKPDVHGYNSAVWTGTLLIDWIDKKYNIRYKKAQIYNIIKSLGFSYQKSKGFYPEADLEAQKQAKEEIKKTK